MLVYRHQIRAKRTGANRGDVLGPKRGLLEQGMGEAAKVAPPNLLRVMLEIVLARVFQPMALRTERNDPAGTVDNDAFALISAYRCV